MKFSTPVEREAPQVVPTELSNLQVTKISIVTEPSILSNEESAQNVGILVARSTDAGPPPPPACVARALAMREGETLGDARERLANACRKAIVAETKDGETYWLDPILIFETHVIMGSYYVDVHEMLEGESQYNRFYRCDYTAGDDFTITRVVKMRLTFSEVVVTETVTPVEDVSREVPSETKEPETPTAEQTPVVREAVVENACQKREEPVEAAAPVVTVEPTTPAAVQTPVVARESEPEGCEKPEDAAVPMAAVSRSVEDIMAEVLAKNNEAIERMITERVERAFAERAPEPDLTKENDRLRQQLARSVSDQPPSAEQIQRSAPTPTQPEGGSPSHLERMMQAGKNQTIRIL